MKNQFKKMLCIVGCGLLLGCPFIAGTANAK